jgi:TonB family protein
MIEDGGGRLRLFAAIVVLMLSAGAAQAIEEITILGRGPRQSITSVRVDPTIASVDQTRGSEAWLHLELSLSATGDVLSAKVVEAHPKKAFDKAIMRVVRRWKFYPPTQDGVAVAAPKFEIGVSFLNALYEADRISDPNGKNWCEAKRGCWRRGVSQLNSTTFRHANDDLNKGDLAAAGLEFERLKRRYDNAHMTVTEIARYFASRTRFNRLRGNYDAALKDVRRALILSQFLDNPKIVPALHLEVLSALAGLGRRDDLVDYYDGWAKVMKGEVPEELTAEVERLRALGSGRGHAYTIVDYGDSTRRVRGLASQSLGGHIEYAGLQSVVAPDANEVDKLFVDVRQFQLDLPSPLIDTGDD